MNLEQKLAEEIMGYTLEFPAPFGCSPAPFYLNEKDDIVMSVNKWKPLSDIRCTKKLLNVFTKSKWYDEMAYQFDSYHIQFRDNKFSVTMFIKKYDKDFVDIIRYNKTGVILELIICNLIKDIRGL